jgi:transcription elongation factor GreA
MTQYVTPEGLKKLEEEVASLKELRKEITERIAEAVKLGDISENAEYHEAKDAQGMNESKIADLEDQLKHTEIIEESNEKSTSVNVGSTIIIQNGDGKKEYTIVGSSEANPSKGFISNESPIGEAFLGHAVGDNVEIKAPSGTITYKIVEIK